MKKKDIISKVLETAKKLTEADGIPLDICDDFRRCIAMVQEINSIEFITVKKEFKLIPEEFVDKTITGYDDHVGGN
tara:strand:+ start:123 stop:350 length:228 start_codon:yes stop_codon:yes gene_type:complete